MRLLYLCSAAGAVVVALFACSDDSGGSGSVTPDGGMITEDGAIVDEDGEVIPPDGAKPSKVTATDETVDVSGTSRNYVLVVPKTYSAAKKYPLIIAIHGDGGTGASFRDLLQLDDVAGDDAIVVYPTAQNWDLYTPYDQNNDQMFVGALIDAVKGMRSIDDTKVWGIGYSKGGFVLNEIACRKPGMLKAMANHASGAPEEMRGNDGYPVCPGVVGLPTMATEGELNKDIGGEYAANYWASINGCGTGRSATTPAPCQKYDNCPADKPVVYCLAPGVSHYPPWTQAAQASWTFFKSL